MLTGKSIKCFFTFIIRIIRISIFLFKLHGVVKMKSKTGSDCSSTHRELLKLSFGLIASKNVGLLSMDFRKFIHSRELPWLISGLISVYHLAIYCFAHHTTQNSNNRPSLSISTFNWKLEIPKKIFFHNHAMRM